MGAKGSRHKVLDIIREDGGRSRYGGKGRDTGPDIIREEEEGGSRGRYGRGVKGARPTHLDVQPFQRRVAGRLAERVGGDAVR